VKSLGISLRKPALAGLRVASVLAVVLWAAAMAVLLAGHVELGGAGAVALLLALAWTGLGMRLGQGRHHLLANLLGCTLLLGVYQLALLLAD